MKVNRDYYYLLKNVTIRVVTVAGKGGACGSIVAVVAVVVVVVVVAAVFLFFVVVAVVTPSKVHLPYGILEKPRYLGLQLP